MPDRTLKWRFAVDRGGTFTDIIGMSPSGDFHTLKLLSRSAAYDDASIEGIKRILGLKTHDALPEDVIEGIRFGTTVATNALLERKGGETALLMTKGLRDLLDIGYQNRPDIFKLCIRKAAPLYGRVIEVDERIDHRGRVIRKIDETALEQAVKTLKESGTESIAVVLMHSWVNPGHEKVCEKLLRKDGFEDIFLSHQSVNLVKIISRGQSTLVDAYLSTVLAHYLNTIQKEAGKIPVWFMQSDGMLAGADKISGKNSVLSGPAGGVVAVAGIARDRNIKGVIGFDMGGTSTDVSRFDDDFQKKYEQVIAGIPLQIEMLDVNTVAAGGGSILGFDGQKMTAGPESAGSYPGPACYGFGGPLTVSDANLMTGRIIPEYFPRIFGSDGNSALDRETVKEKFDLLSAEVNASAGSSFSPYEIANGFLRVANENMAMAIREISVSRGFDIRDYTLVCFGGAGGQHACSLAVLLSIDTIIIHPFSSLMSAYGIGTARPAWKTARSILKRYDRSVHEKLDGLFQEMENGLRQNIRADTGIIPDREIDLRPAGTDTFLTLKYEKYEETVGKFQERYKSLFGFSIIDSQTELVNMRVTLMEPAGFFAAVKEKEPFSSPAGGAPRTEGGASLPAVPKPSSHEDIYFSNRAVNVPVYQKDLLPKFTAVAGPAVILDENSTVIIEPEFEAVRDERGNIIISKCKERRAGTMSQAEGPDPVLLEVFGNLFMGIAHEMGHTLSNTASSVNMKERLDFSCAIFDAEGGLVANAPHIPVHLGSMADTVKTLIGKNRHSMKSGDMYLTNSPYEGGSHLPDMTVMSPVFSDGGELIFCTAARGHHSDVGGITPGSMPPSASHIDEEGVLVENFLLVRDGAIMEEALRRLLAGSRHPARNVPERIHDFRAQIAACHQGSRELHRIIHAHGVKTVTNYMQYIQDNSEYEVRKALNAFLDKGRPFEASFEDLLDDGTLIRVAVSILPGEKPPETTIAVIDFSGTGPEHLNDNLNAPRSVTRSAVLYVLRTLIDRDIPLNSGCLKPVQIIIPGRTVLNPAFPAPVASGNVETSQRIVDVLLGAFGIAAASQGTMNNLLFEVDGEHPYYETVAGGSGAMQGCRGASGVQVHMTNTRITDPEILELRHPGVRLEKFHLRNNSGGQGAFPGGDGVVREIRFLKPATVSIISERRAYPPYGIQGGAPGKKGVNLLKKANGDVLRLPHREVLKVEQNDSIILETPGGGGYGVPE
jgi:5-oxoprolinase (ATP-hydrolysing)